MNKFQAVWVVTPLLPCSTDFAPATFSFAMLPVAITVIAITTIAFTGAVKIYRESPYDCLLLALCRGPFAP